MTLRGGIKVLTNQQMHEIHQVVLRVLREVGLEAHLSDEAYSRLRAQGVRVDEPNKHVWLNEQPVLETIRQITGARSTEVSIDGVDKDPLMHVLPARLTMGIGGHHGFVLDGRNMRDAQHADMFDFLRLKKHILGKVGGSGLLSQEVPGEVAYIHGVAFNVKYCENPWPGDCNGQEDAKWITRIMRAAGVWNEHQSHGGSIYVRSPLCLIDRGAEFLESAARSGRPRVATGMPTAGVTAPGTVAGYVIEYLVECFGFTTVGRLIADPPESTLAPSRLGDDISAFDMRKGLYFLAGPEVSLMRMAAKQIFGEFYKSAGSHCCSIRTFTEAQTPGIQAAMEKVFQAMADLMVGMYSDDEEPVASMDCLGSLNCNLSLSMEQAVIDCELANSLNHMLRGINFDGDAIVESIKRVGPSGQFLSDKYTMDHLKSDWHFPALFHRGAWDAWDSEGRPGVLERAQSVVDESRKLDVPCVLADDVAREVDSLVLAAERELLGTTTGILP